MDEQGVAPARLQAHLPGGLQERLALNVAGGAADLRDDHVSPGLLPHGVDKVFDFIGDVGDHLDGLPQVLAPALLVEHVPVDLAGGQVGVLVQVLVNKPLVVAQVQVGLRPVLGDVHLPVLVRTHGAGVHVDVGVQLLGSHLQPPGLQQAAQAGRGDPLAQTGNHTAGYKDIFGHSRLLSLQAQTRPSAKNKKRSPMPKGGHFTPSVQRTYQKYIKNYRNKLHHFPRLVKGFFAVFASFSFCAFTHGRTVSFCLANPGIL